MWTLLILLLAKTIFAAPANSSGIAEMISNYAKVRISKDSSKNETLVLPQSTSEEPDAAPEYDDFDDEEPEPSRSSIINWDGKTLGKVIAGAISLIGLLQTSPQGQSRQKSFAEDRYNPTTATKKFKYQQGYYSGKTSYDADREQYKTIKDTSTDVKVEPSLSYEPAPEDKKPVYYSYMKQQDEPAATATTPWSFTTLEEQSQWGQWGQQSVKGKPYEDDMADHPEDDEAKPFKEDIPSYMKKPQQEGMAPQMIPKRPYHGDPPQFWNPHHHDLLYDDHLDIHPHDHPIDHPLDHPDDHPMDDEDRDSKRPYSYYFLGRKLWYVPLLFSAYFIIYIGALILKSVARHKIQLPEKIHELSDHDYHDHHDHHRRHRQLVNDLTDTVNKALTNKKFM